MTTRLWVRDELRRWGDHPTRLLLVLAPLLATAVCLAVYSTRTVRNLPVGLLDLDRTGLSRVLVRDLAATPQMRIFLYNDLEAVRRAFRDGYIKAAAILPEGLDREVRRGHTAKIVFWRDATNPMTANQLYSVMATIVATEGARLETGRLCQAGLSLGQAKEMAVPLRADPRGFANPSFDYLSNFAPGLFPMFLQMALMLAAGSMLPSGWKENPTPRRELVARSLPWIGIYSLTAIAFYWFLMPVWGAPATSFLPTFALLTLLFLASLACGAVFGRLIQSPIPCGQFLLAFNTPAFPLSGYTFPEWAMPPLLSAVTRPLPFSLFVDAYRGLAGGATTPPVWGWIGLVGWLVGSAFLLSIPRRKRQLAPASVQALGETATGSFSSLRLELVRLTRSPGLSTLVLVAPVLYLALYGGMYADKEERRLPLAVTGGFSSSMARQISTALGAHPQLRPIPMDPSDALVALQRNEVRAILAIPENLDVRIRRCEATPIPLLFVADRFLPANDLQRSIGEILSGLGAKERSLFLQGKGLAPDLARERATTLILDDRPLGNPRETYGDFMLPSLGILILHQLCLIASAFASAAFPRGRTNYVTRLGLLVGWYGLWMAFWVGIVLPAMSVPVDPQILPLVALGLLGLVATALAGSCLGFLIGDPGMAAQLLAFSSYPFFFSSGASWPRELFPGFISGIGKLVPLTPWISGTNRALRMGAGFGNVAREITHLGILVAFWAMGLFFAIQFFRRWPKSN